MGHAFLLRHIKPLLIMMLALAVNSFPSIAQEYRVESFEVLPNDLTARTEGRVDANGRKCAVIKIYVRDAVTEAAGPVVGDVVDKGMEKRVYVSHDARQMELHFKEHMPLRISFSDYNFPSLTGQMTYRMRLSVPGEEGAPGRGADDSSQSRDATDHAAFDPVAMAGEGEPLLPKWWNTHEDGLYVGISAPALDAKSARQMALLNALFTFAQATENQIVYHAVAEGEEPQEMEETTYCALNTVQSYVLKSAGFEIDIYKEYYNSEGEYFILCRILPGANAGNAFEAKWSMESINDFKNKKWYCSGELRSEISATLQANGGRHDLGYDYGMNWNGDDVGISCMVKGKKMIDEKIPLAEVGDDLTAMKLKGNLGTCQTRLLSALTCVPDSVMGSGQGILDDSEVSQTFSHTASLEWRGHNQPRKIQLIDYSDGLEFRVAENFPKLMEEARDFAKKDLYGLSDSYQQYLGAIGPLAEGKGTGDYCFEIGYGDNEKGICLLETKNNAFASGVSSALNVISSVDVVSSTSSSIDSITGNENIHMKISQYYKTPLPVEIKPLWLLDPVHRIPYMKRKDAKEWRKYQKEWQDEVFVLALVPKDPSSSSAASATQPDDLYNGHGWVDLGLPTGLRWASCNVGADGPGDYGGYFAWGETTTKSEYTDANSLMNDEKDVEDISGSPEYDVARDEWGGNWRMPTLSEFEELIENCRWESAKVNGINGYHVTGPNGNSIFLPAGGYRREGMRAYRAGSFGSYWSSTPDTGYSKLSYNLKFLEGGGYEVTRNSRRYGFSVRPVLE